MTTFISIIKIFLILCCIGGGVLWILARIAYYVRGLDFLKHYSFRQFTTIHFSSGYNYINLIDYMLKAFAFIALIYTIWRQF